jgi:uncharacterized membrane protein (UPF0127 family)
MFRNFFRPRPRRVSLRRGEAVLGHLVVEMAATPWRRARGLMGRDRIEGDGMLLAYPWPRVARIWMHRTTLALDVLFIDAGGWVIGMAEGLQPGARSVVSSAQAVKWVLELPAGRCAGLAVEIGDRLVFEPD